PPRSRTNPPPNPKSRAKGKAACPEDLHPGSEDEEESIGSANGKGKERATRTISPASSTHASVDSTTHLTNPPPISAQLPAKDPLQRESSVEVKERERLRAKPGESKRVTVLEERINKHRYDPSRDTRRKAYTTGVDALLARGRFLAIKTNATVYVFVARLGPPLPPDPSAADQSPVSPSHKVFNSGDNPSPLVATFHSQPSLYPASPTDEQLSEAHPPAPWAKFAVDCPTFTPLNHDAFETHLTPVSEVFDRMLDMFGAVVRPGQEEEAQGRKAATVAKRKEKGPVKRRIKKDTAEEARDRESAESAELLTGRRAVATQEAMVALLRRAGVSEEEILKAL
ncbi:hypothetical protein P7C70_g9190, partial [Phenoliferia sp. Uapishka_3]